MLQFVFLGNNGFRFPFAHFPTKEADPASLYTNFWKAVGWLRRFGFQANYCCCDGGEANRSFIKMHFKGQDPVEERFTTINPYTRKPMVFLLDPSVSHFVVTCSVLQIATIMTYCNAQCNTRGCRFFHRR